MIISTNFSFKVFEIGSQPSSPEWHGGSSKLMKSIFAMAHNTPAIVWIDKGNALLSENNNANDPDDRVPYNKWTRCNRRYAVSMDAQTNGNENTKTTFSCHNATN